MKFNRRQFLWGGLGATIAAVLGRNVVRTREATAQQAALEALYDPETLIEEAYQADLEMMQNMASEQTDAQLQSPTVPYNRAWSKQIIVAARMTTLQYQRGRFEADYDGSIDVLPLYQESGFERFQQVAALEGIEPAQEQIRFEVPVSDLIDGAEDLADLQESLSRTQDAIEQQIEQVVQISQRIPVYYGFLLTSDEFHMLVFRGTQRRFDVLTDLLTLQLDYTDPLTEEALGRVHLGFYSLYLNQFADTVQEAVRSLDPSKPLIVAGHSLGGAVANIAAMDIAIQQPAWRPNLHIYTYGAPRVGNDTFAENLSRMVPNHYRVVNLADMVPMTPLSELFAASFAHGGEQWSFLSHHGDVGPNHLIDVYRNAIMQEAEGQDNERFINLPIDLSAGLGE